MATVFITPPLTDAEVVVLAIAAVCWLLQFLPE